MPENILDFVKSAEILRLVLLILLGAIAAPVATIYLLRRHNGLGRSDKPANGGGAQNQRLVALEAWRVERDRLTHEGFQRLASVESDVASLKDEFVRTHERLEKRMETEHEKTRRRVEELAEAVGERATSMSGEFK